MIRFLAVVLSLAAMTIVAMVPLDWKGQLELGALFIGIAMVLPKFSKHPRITLALIVLSIFSSSRYAYWRISETIHGLRATSDIYWVDLIFIVALLGAEAYAFVILILGYFQTVRTLNRPPLPLPADPDTWPSVDVFIPTYNETLTVVRATVLASLSLDYPQDKLRIFILDDGRRPEFREFAELCGCEYMIRPDNKHAKAGNINHALAQTGGEFVSIFDCDHIPTRSFLQMSLGWFLKDPKLGMLQTPHHFYSPDPFERNLKTFREIPNEGALFYGIVQDGNDFWNATFFCGSCAVIRRTALDEVGGIAVETVTEDAHTSLRIQKRGWNTAYLNVPQAAGLATGSLVAHIGQRIRWARGMVQILRTENILFAKALRWPQRLCYFNAVAHFLYPIPRLIFLTAPLVYILLGRSNLLGYVLDIFAYALPHLFLSTTTNSQIQGRYRHAFWNEVYETILAPYILLPTTVALFAPKLGKFNVTSKGDVFDSSFFDWHIARPYLALLGLSFLGIGIAIYKMVVHSAPLETISVNLLWLLFNSVILGVSIAVAGETRQRRATVRIDALIPLELILPDNSVLQGETVNISMGGARVKAPTAVQLSVGEKVFLSFEDESERAEIPATVKECSGGLIRVQFDELPLDTETQLVRVIYGRADTWLTWRRGRVLDRPVFSLMSILRHAVGGLGTLLKAVFVRHKPQAASTTVLLLACLLTLGGRLNAAAPPPATASRTFSESHDLASLGAKKNLELRGADTSAAVFFQIPLTKVVDHANLDLQFRPSPNLNARASRLEVLLNGASVANVTIEPKPNAPEATLTLPLDLPAVQLTSDNVVRFRFQGVCSFDCEAEDGSANYWLRIDVASRMHISGSILSLVNQLRLLPAPFFDRSQQRAIQIPFVFAASPTTEEFQAACIAASWFGLLADYRGIHFPVSTGSIPAGNVILVGVRTSPLIAAFNLGAVPGPTISMRANPGDPYGKVLLITGDDGNQLLAAARALAEEKFSRTGDLAVIEQTTPPAPRPLYDAARWLSTSHDTGLGDFSSGEQLKIYGNSDINLYFRIPPDLYFGQRREVPLRLLYRCSGIRSLLRAEMIVRLNGRPIAQKPLSIKSLTEAASLVIPLPTASLALNNTINITFSFGNLAPIPGGRAQNPEITVLKNSEVDISNIPHFVEIPKLELFANTGFPYTRSSDLAQTAVIIPDRAGSASLENALDVIGFFGARTGSPGLLVTVARASDLPSIKDKDLLVFGDGSSEMFPDSWWSKASLRLSQTQPSLLPLSRWLDRLQSLPGSNLAHDRTDLQDWAARGIPELLLEQFPSPVDAHRVVTLLDGAPLQQQAALQLVTTGDPAVAKLFGDVSLYEEGAFHSFIVQPTRTRLGSLPMYESFNFWAARYFVGIPLLLILIAILLGSLADSWLDRWLKARMKVMA